MGGSRSDATGEKKPLKPLWTGSQPPRCIHCARVAGEGGPASTPLHEAPPNQQHHCRRDGWSMSGVPGPKVQRRLAAIFAADVEGYSRLMGVDEVGTLRTLTSHREIMDRLIGKHGGRIANTAGDSVLAEFPSVVDAVQAAVEVQEALRTSNEPFPEDRQVRFRIGVHVGDVMVKAGDLFGDGVNIAARLQALAEPGGVCISGF